MLKDDSRIKLAIVDDHNLFRKGLIKLINMGDEKKKYEILFEAESGNDLIAKLNNADKPDIILMDIDMPGMSGYEAVEWLQRSHPAISVLVISMFETEEAVTRMLGLNVKGYLSKDIEVEDMHQALESIIRKGHYYPEFVSRIIAQSVRGERPDLPISSIKLTQKEREFLQYVCTDLTYKEIADKMVLSVKTIDGYRETMFQKFDTKSRVALAMFAVKNGLVKL